MRVRLKHSPDVVVAAAHNGHGVVLYQGGNRVLVTDSQDVAAVLNAIGDTLAKRYDQQDAVPDIVYSTTTPARASA